MKVYKNRKIDFSKPVQVYRNLHKKSLRYSIRQNGLVVAHANVIYMEKCKFVVSERGRQWVIKNNKKIVHAYVQGHITPNAKKEIKKHAELPLIIEYNPYKYDSFVSRNLFIFADRIMKIDKLDFVKFDGKVVRGIS